MSNFSNYLETVISDERTIQGTVDWYRGDKGYGIILLFNNVGNNESVFVYHTNIVHSTPLVPCLKAGEVVEFKVMKSYHNKKVRYQAYNLTAPNSRKLMFEKYYDANTKEFNNVNKVSMAPVNDLVSNMRIVNTMPSEIDSKTFVFLDNYFKDIKCGELLSEVNTSHLNSHSGGVWKLWHNDSHLIADDYSDWKNEAHIFKKVVAAMAELFEVDVKATRLNMYVSGDYKPLHQDAAAFKLDKAIEQNFTITVSFGAPKNIVFKHLNQNTIIEFIMQNGSVYAFGKDLNINWQHGVLPSDSEVERVSIVMWCYKNFDS